MRAANPALVLDAAEPPADAGLPPVALRLALMPGECALIEMRDAAAAADFADLCCGLLAPVRGQVQFLGRDWADLPDEHGAALRGSIGRVHGTGAWVSFLGMDANILPPQLHHTRRDVALLRERASALARGFGLRGLPLTRPGALPPADLARAACVRAFLGEPRLVLLESPVQAQFSDLIPPLLNALAAARDRGAAAIWLTRRDVVRADPWLPATQRLRLTEHGLALVRAVP